MRVVPVQFNSLVFICVVGWGVVEWISTYVISEKLISHPSKDSKTAKVAQTHYAIFKTVGTKN
jgi:hypothetical protein